MVIASSPTKEDMPMGLLSQERPQATELPQTNVSLLSGEASIAMVAIVMYPTLTCALLANASLVESSGG